MQRVLLLLRPALPRATSVSDTCCSCSSHPNTPHQENTLGQKFLVDATLYCGRAGLAAAGASDALGDSVNYADVYERMRAVRRAAASDAVRWRAARGSGGGGGSQTPCSRQPAVGNGLLSPPVLFPAAADTPFCSTTPHSVAPPLNPQVMEGPPFKLLEAAAAALCDGVFDSQPRVAAVRVHVRKPHVALRGALESVGIEILRARR